MEGYEFDQCGHPVTPRESRCIVLFFIFIFFWIIFVVFAFVKGWVKQLGLLMGRDAVSLPLSIIFYPAVIVLCFGAIWVYGRIMVRIMEKGVKKCKSVHFYG